MKRLTIFSAAIAATVFSVVASTALVSDASAKTLKSAVGLATSSVQFYTHQRFADYVEKHTDLKIKVYSMSLLNLKETPPGVRDGVADMGFVLPPYYPAEYAENNLPANLSMLSTTGRQVESPGAAMAGATTEYTYFNCPECLAEYKKQNQIYLGTGSSPTYINLCTTPLRSLEDLKGKKYRSGAANFGRWAEHFGGIKVSIPGNDIYEAMDQGVIDCAMLSATELTNLSLFDLTKFVVRRIPGGVFSGIGTINVNRDTWRGLTTAERLVFLKGGARATTDLTWKYYADAMKNIADSPSKGVEVIEPGPEIMKASAEFVKGDVKVVAAQFAKDYGIKNVDAKIVMITALIEKWKGLTADIGNDPEALTKVYWEQIFSKIDPATFGMD